MPKTDPSKQPTSTPKDKKIVENSKVEFTIPFADIKPVYKQTLRKMAKSVKLAGFRQGKVPNHLAEKALGQDKILEETLQRVVPDYYDQAIKKNKFSPITLPKFNPKKIVMGEDFEFVAEFAERPEVNLKNYQKEVKVAFKEAKEEIDKRNQELKKLAKKETEDKTKVADPKTASQIPQELTPDQIKDIQLQFIFKKLIETTDLKIQQLLLEEEAKASLNDLVRQLKQINLELEQYLKNRQMSFEELYQEATIQALAKLQIEFILQEITVTEKFKASEKEVTDKLGKIENLDIRKRLTTDEHYLDNLKTVIKREKTIDFLLKLA